MNCASFLSQFPSLSARGWCETSYYEVVNFDHFPKPKHQHCTDNTWVKGLEIYWILNKIAFILSYIALKTVRAWRGLSVESLYWQGFCLFNVCRRRITEDILNARGMN